MTAIVYKDGILAVDSLLMEGDDMRFCNIEKARVVKAAGKVWIMASAGVINNSVKMMNHMEDWLLGVGREDCMERSEEDFDRHISREYDCTFDGEGTLVVVKPSGGWTYFNAKGFDGHYPASVACHSGSAYSFLAGAIAAGASPGDAVSLACVKLASCGLPVRVYENGIGQIGEIV